MDRDRSARSLEIGLRLGVVLWVQAAPQPIAHALTIPTIFAQGICLALGGFAKRSEAGDTSAPIAHPIT